MTLTKELLDPYVLALVGNTELTDIWWHSPNKAFNNTCPISSDLELVKDYLMWHLVANYGL